MWDFSRKIDVPANNDTRQQVVAGTWLVYWREIKDATIITPGVALGETHVEVFSIEQEAKDFVTALTNAYALTKSAGAKWIRLERRK